MTALPIFEFAGRFWLNCTMTTTLPGPRVLSRSIGLCPESDSLNERPDNQKLTQFKKEIANYVIVGLCPPVIKPETSSSERFIEPLMENFVGWFHRYSQENMGSIGGLFEALRESLPDFHSIRITGIR